MRWISIAVCIVFGCSRSDPVQPVSGPQISEADVERIAKKIVTQELEALRVEKAKLEQETTDAIAASVEARKSAIRQNDTDDLQKAKERALALLKEGDKERIDTIKRMLSKQGIWISQHYLNSAVGEYGDILVQDVVEASKRTDTEYDKLALDMGLSPKEKTYMALEFDGQKRGVIFGGARSFKQGINLDHAVRLGKKYWPLKYMLAEYADKKIEREKLGDVQPLPNSAP